MRTREEAIEKPAAGDRWEGEGERNTVLKVTEDRIKCRTHFPIREGSRIWIINDAVTTKFKMSRWAEFVASATFLGGAQ